MAYIVGRNISAPDMLDQIDIAITHQIVVTAYSVTGNGNGSAIGIDKSGNQVTPQTWTLTCKSDTSKFEVEGSISGQTDDATVGEPYDNGEVKFLIIEGSNEWQEGDIISFEVKNTTTTPLVPIEPSYLAKLRSRGVVVYNNKPRQTIMRYHTAYLGKDRGFSTNSDSILITGLYKPMTSNTTKSGYGTDSNYVQANYILLTDLLEDSQFIDNIPEVRTTVVNIRPDHSLWFYSADAYTSSRGTRSHFSIGEFKGRWFIEVSLYNTTNNIKYAVNFLRKNKVYNAGTKTGVYADKVDNTFYDYIPDNDRAIAKNEVLPDSIDTSDYITYVVCTDRTNGNIDVYINGENVYSATDNGYVKGLYHYLSKLTTAEYGDTFTLDEYWTQADVDNYMQNKPQAGTYPNLASVLSLNESVQEHQNRFYKKDKDLYYLGGIENFETQYLAENVAITLGRVQDRIKCKSYHLFTDKPYMYLMSLTNVYNSFDDSLYISSSNLFSTMTGLGVGYYGKPYSPAPKNYEHRIDKFWFSFDTDFKNSSLTYKIYQPDNSNVSAPSYYCKADQMLTQTEAFKANFGMHYYTYYNDWEKVDDLFAFTEVKNPNSVFIGVAPNYWRYHSYSTMYTTYKFDTAPIISKWSSSVSITQDSDNPLIYPIQFYTKKVINSASKNSLRRVYYGTSKHFLKVYGQGVAPEDTLTNGGTTYVTMGSSIRSGSNELYLIKLDEEGVM